VSETIAGTPPPDRRPVRSSTTSLEIVAESFSLLGQSLTTRWDVWLLAAIFFTSTNIVDIVFAPPGNPFHSPLMVASLIIRVVANVWAVTAAARVLTMSGRVWAIDLPLLRCTGAFVALIVLSLVLMVIAKHVIVNPVIAAMTQVTHATHRALVVFTGVWLIGFAIVTVRLSAWLVALAIGDRAMDFSAAWRGMQGANLAAIGALIWTSPVPIGHLVLTSQAQDLRGPFQVALTVIDGLVSVLQVMLMMAMAAVLYRFASNNKPAP